MCDKILCKYGCEADKELDICCIDCAESEKCKGVCGTSQFFCRSEIKERCKWSATEIKPVLNSEVKEV